MTNIWIICRKELKSYFASPIAYLLIVLFAAVWGLVFWLNVREFVRFGFMSQLQGRNMPMNVNEQVIRPMLGLAATIALFLIPMITMRLFAEEKKTGTIELLLTSPVRDLRDHPREMAGRAPSLPVRAGCVLHQHRHSFCIRQAGPEAHPDRVSGFDPTGRHAAGDRDIHLHYHQEPDHSGRRHFLRVSVALVS